MKHLGIIGVLSAVSAYPFIAVSIALSPWFDFRNNALSDLGNIARNTPVAYFFNAGLILSGFLVALFALSTSLRHRSWSYLSWSILLAATGVDLALIGIFSEDFGRIHGIVSVIFFVLMIIVMLIYGVSSLISKDYTTGVLALVLSTASAMIWIIQWDWRGVAIQETLTSLMASVWLVTASFRCN